MQRRTFVHALGASLATGPWASRVTGSPRRLNRIGLELYSVRDAMGRDPDGTLAAVRAMGYTDVELLDRKSTRLNSSHSQISYAVFCLKKKKETDALQRVTPARLRLRHALARAPAVRRHPRCR